MRWSSLREGWRVRLVLEESPIPGLVGAGPEGYVEELRKDVLGKVAAVLKLDEPLPGPLILRVIVEPRHRANLVTFFSRWLAVYVSPESDDHVVARTSDPIALGVLRRL